MAYGQESFSKITDYNASGSSRRTVLDLPQLYQKPTAESLLSTLAELNLTPPSWDGMSSASDSVTSSRETPNPGSEHTRKIDPEGIPAYLTRIVANPLSWIESDAQRELIWATASLRLSERSGRTAMGGFSRTFNVPLLPDVAEETDQNAHATSDGSGTGRGSSVVIRLHEPALTADNLGLKTWAASYLLAKRLSSARRLLPSTTRSAPILELGAGTGLVGLAAAAVFRCHVILTDLPEIVPNLARNVYENSSVLSARGGSAEATILDWSDLNGSPIREARSFQLILVADPIYSPEHAALLVDAIGRHLSSDSEARLVLEIPLRDAYTAERTDLRDRLEGLALRIVCEGEESGVDDWIDSSQGEDVPSEVRCWWSIWAWR